jgi:hypothetical protein
MDAKRRRQVWVERQNFQGWACTECAWVFSASGPPVGNSLEEMKQNYEQRRDKEFASHVCAQHPRAEKDPVSQVSSRVRLSDRKGMQPCNPPSALRGRDG